MNANFQTSVYANHIACSTLFIHVIKNRLNYSGDLRPEMEIYGQLMHFQQGELYLSVDDVQRAANFQLWCHYILQFLFYDQMT